MEKSNSIHLDISGFIENTNEIDVRSLLDYKCLIVNDIYTAVYQCDPEYADELLKGKKIFGLCYVNKNNQFELLIKKADVINMHSSICHEYVHMADYYHLGLLEKNPDYRTLQEDCYFELWSEFHASYLTYQHLYTLGKESLDPVEIFTQLRNKFENYYFGSGKSLDLQTTVDFIVRLYGEYIALEEQYENIEKYPNNFFINQEFLDLYNYLYDHRDFQSVVKCMDNLKEVFKSLEPKK